MGFFRSSSRASSKTSDKPSSVSRARNDISSTAATSPARPATTDKGQASDLHPAVNSASASSRILSIPVNDNVVAPSAGRVSPLSSTDLTSGGPARVDALGGSAGQTSPTSRNAVGMDDNAAVTGDESGLEDSSDEDEFVDAESGVSTPLETGTKRPGPARAASDNGPLRPQPLKAGTSKAARLAAAKMEEDVTPRAKIGKKLHDLTSQDVALTEADIREDISIIWKAVHLFLSSRMVEAEEICLSASDHRLYYSVGYSLIQAIKSLATFEPEDLDAAIQCCKDSIAITQLLRKKDHGLFERVGSLAKGSTSVHSIKAMTPVQRHAELVFAECTLLKAVLGIIYSGDFLAFLKEALNMRNAYAIYRTLAKYVETADREYGGSDEEDPAIDQDFRSGVRLGNGMISLILSLLPSAVLKIMEVFGFTGDRDWALATLMKAGGWKAGVAQPTLEPEKEGIRGPICDMVLLMYHLVIANYLPVGGVDVPTAANILHHNLDRYPSGIFFLYFAGRLHSTETMLDEAISSFHLAIQAQREYIQLGHICYWDLGLVSLAQSSWAQGYECFSVLDKESNWSKAIYAYAKATTLYEQGIEAGEVQQTMAHVPDLLQRIAGKSIPLEKFVARRARKFVAQGNRLTLPGIELAYVLNCLGLSPRFILFDQHLDQVAQVVAELQAVQEPAKYGLHGDEYWNDYCLAHLLHGIILRFIAHPEPHVVPRPSESPIPVHEADERALESFQNVLKHGREISHDHHVVWFAHYELGRLYQARGDWALAREQYELVMSGKHLEVNSAKKGKGKVSLQNMAVLRSNAGLALLKEQGH